MKTKIEYRVRPVTRYVLTRFESQIDEENGCRSGGSISLGEFDRADTAFHIGCALARDDDKEPVVKGHELDVIPPIHPDHIDPNVGYEVKPY